MGGTGRGGLPGSPVVAHLGSICRSRSACSRRRGRGPERGPRRRRSSGVVARDDDPRHGLGVCDGSTGVSRPQWPRESRPVSVTDQESRPSKADRCAAVAGVRGRRATSARECCNSMIGAITKKRWLKGERRGARLSPGTRVALDSRALSQKGAKSVPRLARANSGKLGRSARQRPRSADPSIDRRLRSRTLRRRPENPSVPHRSKFFFVGSRLDI